MNTLSFSATESLPPLVIFGVGGLGREVLLLVRQLNKVHPIWDIRGFYDDQPPAAATVAGLPYLGGSSDLNASTEPVAVAVAVGSPVSRAAVVARLTSPQLYFPVLVHPSVEIATHQAVLLGEGCIVQRGGLFTCDITLGRFVLVNLACTIGHDAVLEDFCSLMPHANVSGAAYLETGAYLGTGATVIQGVRVGAHSILGAGAVAVRNVPAHSTAVGVPARELKMRNEQ